MLLSGISSFFQYISEVLILAVLLGGVGGCAAGWGRIFTTGLTIMGSYFQ